MLFANYLITQGNLCTHIKNKEHSLLEIRKFREFHSNIKASQGYIYPLHKTYRFIIHVSPSCLVLFSWLSIPGFGSSDENPFVRTLAWVFPFSVSKPHALEGPEEGAVWRTSRGWGPGGRWLFFVFLQKDGRQGCDCRPTSQEGRQPVWLAPSNTLHCYRLPRKCVLTVFAPGGMGPALHVQPPPSSRVYLRPSLFIDSESVSDSRPTFKKTF